MDLQNRIKTILNEDDATENSIITQLENLGHESDGDFFANLFRILIRYDFTAEEASNHWDSILQHKTRMEEKLGRLVSFRVVLMDYFINNNKVLHNPMVIEISMFDAVLNSAMVDELTSLYNRRYYNIHIERELKRAMRYGHNVSLLMFDIDDFKRFNDSFGHACGDLALQGVGEAIRSSLRLEDVPCRIGGEEFTVILPEVSSQQALVVATRFQKELGRMELPSEQSVHVSGGISQFPRDGDTAEALLRSADQALYRAKRSGKAKFFIAAEA